jgi:hypothetical protein
MGPFRAPDFSGSNGFPASQAGSQQRQVSGDTRPHPATIPAGERRGVKSPMEMATEARAADRRCVQVARQRPWAGEGAAARPLGYERRRAADRGWRHCGDRANRRHSGAAPAAVQPDRAAVPGPLARRRIHWGTASVRRDEQGCEVLWFLPGEVPHRPPESLGWRRRSLASPLSAQWHSEL